MTSRLKQQRAKVKLKKDCKKEKERLELENMKLKLDLEQRVVAFMDQMEDFFAVVDSLFTEDDVRTLGEANFKWAKFKEVLEETQDVDAALAAIGREPKHNSERNGQLVNKFWSK